MSVIDGSDFDEPVHFTGKGGEPRPLHRFARRLKLILWLWLLISLPMVYIVYVMIEPAYEASSILRIEPSRPELFGPSVRGMDSTGYQPYLETQRNLILTDRVLDAALGDRDVGSFPLLREAESTDPKVDLRNKLLVTIVPETYLIRVSYCSNDRKEAFAVVKAVVDAFIRQHREFNLGDTDLLKDQYEGFIKTQAAELGKKKLELLELAAKADQVIQEEPQLKGQPSRIYEIKAAFLKEEIGSLTGNIRTVERKLEQLKFESSNQLVRVFLQDPASLPKIPMINKRVRYMGIIPIATLVTLVALSLIYDLIRRPRWMAR